MLISVPEAVSTIYHMHDGRLDMCSGKFGRSHMFHDGCIIVKSDYFDDVFKIFKHSDGFVVYVDGIGAFGFTVEDAVHAVFKGHKVPSFDFKIGE